MNAIDHLNPAQRTQRLQSLGAMSFDSLYSRFKISVDDQPVQIVGVTLTSLHRQLLANEAAIGDLDARYVNVGAYLKEFDEGHFSGRATWTHSNLTAVLAGVRRSLNGAAAAYLVDPTTVASGAAIAGIACLCGAGLYKVGKGIYDYCNRPCMNVDAPSTTAPGNSNVNTFADSNYNAGSVILEMAELGAPSGRSRDALQAAALVRAASDSDLLASRRRD